MSDKHSKKKNKNLFYFNYHSHFGSQLTELMPLLPFVLLDSFESHHMYK